MDGVSTAERDAGGLPFTAAARRLLAGAREESDRLAHEYVGTEHLVLALARQWGDPADQARLGVDWQGVRAQLAELLQPGARARALGGALPYTTRTKQVFALAGESARALGHGGVAVEHLLLGIMRERVGIGAQVLAHHGLTEPRALAHAQQGSADTSMP